MKPLHREKSKGRTIYLEGVCYYPAGDELSAKFQRNAKRLEDGSRFTIDFSSVTSIDAGAAVGIVDGIQFSLDSNSTLIINLRSINVSLLTIDSILSLIKEHFINQLKLSGLPKNVLINNQPQNDDFDMEELEADSVRKRTTVTSSESL